MFSYCNNKQYVFKTIFKSGIFVKVYQQNKKPKVPTMSEKLNHI